MKSESRYEAVLPRRPRRAAAKRVLAGVAAAALTVGLIMAFSSPASGGPRVARQAQDISTGRSIAARVRPGVVIINARLRNISAFAEGSGMVLSPQGLVLTNYHVIRNTASITATVAGETYQATVVGYDRADDIALIRLQGASGLRTIPVGDSSHVTIGQQTAAQGNADGRGVVTMSTGTVTGLNVTVVASETGGSETLHGMIKSSAAIAPGDSGGPLATPAGVIGMDTAGTGGHHGQGTSFAIPIAAALRVAGQIAADNASSVVTVG
jgi:S1-C subfamily serine protease